MFSDGFKKRYTTIPFAIYKKGNIDTATLYSHYHKEIELITVIEGSVDFYIGSDLYEVKAGDVLVIPPYAVHHAFFHPNTYHEWICFDASILWDESLKGSLEKGTITVSSAVKSNSEVGSLVYECTRAAFNAYEKREPGWELEAIGNLSIIFGRLCASSFFVNSKNVDTEQDFVRNVLEYIKGHFDYQITSTTVAETLYINNSYFCRIFKKRFGCCFSEYLTNYRIEQAKMLLNMTDMSVSDIAIKCGFCGFSYFSKTFKEKVGSTPSKYRLKKAD